jgi:hypothetical protein
LKSQGKAKRDILSNLTVLGGPKYCLLSVIHSMETSIKIIKRKERELCLEDQQLSVGVSKTDIQLRRELAETVASWIEERRTQVTFKSLPNVQQSEQSIPQEVLPNNPNT